MKYYLTIEMHHSVSVNNNGICLYGELFLAWFRVIQSKSKFEVFMYFLYKGLPIGKVGWGHRKANML